MSCDKDASNSRTPPEFTPKNNTRKNRYYLLVTQAVVRVLDAALRVCLIIAVAGTETKVIAMIKLLHRAETG